MATLTQSPYTSEYRWSGTEGRPSYWKHAKAVRGDRVLRCEGDDGYTVELYDTGKMYTLRVYYWRSDRDASKEGYTHDSRYCGSDWATVVARAMTRDVTSACIALVESEADDQGVELR